MEDDKGMVSKKYSSLSDIIQIVTNIAHKKDGVNFVFRGQKDHSILIPKLFRGIYAESVCMDELSFAEKHGLNLFENQYLPYSQHKSQSLLELMAIAQHHGMATRLLDWTTSLTTAIWMSLSRNTYQEYQTAFSDDRVTEKPIIYMLEVREEDFFSSSELSDMCKKQIDEQYSDLNNSIRFYLPPAISQRIIVQKSVFSVHPISANERIPLEADPFIEDRLLYVLYPKEDLKSIILHQELAMIGVTEGSVYTDLAGLAGELNLWIAKSLHAIKTGKIDISKRLNTTINDVS